LNDKSNTPSKSILIKAQDKSQNEADKETFMHLLMREGCAVILLFLSLYLLLALGSFHAADPGWTYTGKDEVIHNSMGRAGAWLADVLFNLFGYVAFLLPVLLAHRAVLFLKKDFVFKAPEYPRLLARVATWLAFMAFACGLLALHILAHNNLPADSAGGVVGLEMASFSVKAFNVLGGSIILFALLLVSISFATNISWVTVVEIVGKKSLQLFNKLQVLAERAIRKQQEKEEIKEKQSEREQKFEVAKKRSAERKTPTISQPKPEVPVSKRVEKERQKSLFTTKSIFLSYRFSRFLL